MRILITAGPTREPLDPVRYLTNRSSGKMGYALAAAASQRGYEVILISGPTCLDVPPQVDFIPVESAREMYQAVQNQIGLAEVGIFSAAVSDYRPVAFSPVKIKKTGESMTVELTRNPDILGSTRSEFGFKGTLVGFAAETESLETNARAKLECKGCDLVVANDVSKPDIGFDTEENQVLLVFPEHSDPLPRESKQDLAFLILDAIEDLRSVKG